MINVKPEMMTTALELAKYSVETRQCYFNSDRSLRFFKYYSQSNCEFECLTNFTLLACDCVRVTMPRDNTTRICQQQDRQCADKSSRLFRAKSLDNVEEWKKSERFIMFEFDSEKVEPLMRFSCNCLPSCVSLNYEITTLPLLLDDRHLNEANSASRESKVLIHFENAHFLKTKRSEIYGWGDFIANCGGLLGES